MGVFALMPALDPPHAPQPDFSNGLASLHAALILLAYRRVRLERRGRADVFDAGT